MTIPVYRQNLDYDDWEVASVYDSDDCDSLGRSAYYGSSHSSSSLDDPGFQPHDLLYEDTRPRVDYVVPHAQPPPQLQNYAPVMLTRSRWDTCHVPGKRSNFALPPAPIVPPPGVIFPPKDWALPPQDMYWPCTTGHVVSSSGMPVDMALMEPPPSSLLLSPSSPPRAPSPLIRRPTPTKTIAHGQAPHATSATVSSTGTGMNVNTYTPIMPPPPRYHELAHTISPRLAEAGCQVHPGMVMSPRRSGHDVLSSYGPEASMPRGSLISEEITVAEGHGGGGGGPGGHPSYGPGDRPDLHAPPGPSKYEYEHKYGYGYDAGRMRTTRPPMRERRPSIWQRFVRRFGPSPRGVSVGHT